MLVHIYVTIPNSDSEWCFVDAEDLYAVNQSRCFPSLVTFQLHDI